MSQLDSIMPDIFRATQALTIHDGQTALEILQRLESEDPDVLQKFAELACIYGLTQYELGNFYEAIDFFIYSISWEPHDATVQFYIGNCFLKLRRLENAKTCFENALMIRKFFPEAQNNLAITNCSLMQGHIKFLDWERIEWYINPDLNFDVEDLEACLDIPIFINNRDRVDCPKNLIDWLLNAGYRRIYILDQGSTYPPLLEFYETLRREQRVHVFRMKNLGFQAMWKSGVLEDLDIRTPYVYADSDVLPAISEERGRFFIQELLRTLKKYPLVKKAAPMIRTEDIRQSLSLNTVEKVPFMQIDLNEIAAPSDTSFAVYRDARHYNLIYSVVRTDLELLHLPFYFDLNNLPEDEKYYIAHANRDSYYASYVKNMQS